MRKLTPIVIIAALSLITWQSGAIERFTIPAVTPQEAQKLQGEGKAVIVDVREESEIRQGMVKNSLWLPWSALQKEEASALDTLQKLDKDQEVLLYCRSGNRSGKAAAFLKRRGFKVRNLGGYLALKEAGLPTSLPSPERSRH